MPHRALAVYQITKPSEETTLPQENMA